MAVDLTRLTEEVTEAKTVAASAKTLIEGIAQKLRDMAATEANLNAAVSTFADELDASSNNLQTAVVENTPAEG